MKLNADEHAIVGGDLMITDIMATLETPNGFSKLQPNQRKILLAAILGSIIPCDGKIREVEVKHLRDHLQQRFGLTTTILKSAIAHASIGLNPEYLKKACAQLPELLSIEDRTNLIGMLWDIALCDHELHSTEEKMIYAVADSSGVPRKRVAEMQSRAQSNIGR